MTQNHEALELISQAKSQARSENLQKFLRSKLAIRATLAVITLAVLFSGFAVFQNVQQEKFSEILHQSLINQQAGAIDKAKENLKRIYEAKLAPNGVKSLASLRYAALLLNDGKKMEAAKIYQKLNHCRSCDDYVQELGGLLAVRTWMSDEEEMKKEDLAARIEKIENSSNILRYYISEQRALLEMHKNNLEKSYQIFEAIAKNPEGPQVVKARATDGLKMIAARGFEPKIENKEASAN